MKRNLLLFLCLFFSIAFLNAQTFYTDDCDGPIVGWDQSSSSYVLSQVGTAQQFDVSWGNTQWVGVYNNLDGAVIDVSSNPVINVDLMAMDRPFKLTCYMFCDTGGYRTVTQRVLPSDDFVTYTFDFTSYLAELDFSQITATQFTCNGQTRGYSGTFQIDNLEIGTTAALTASIAGEVNKEYYLNSGSKEVLLTDIVNADNVSVSGGAGIVENLAVTAINGDGHATISFDLVTDAVGTGTITVTANGSAGYANNTYSFDVIIEDNITPVIDQSPDVEMVDGETIDIIIGGISDANVSKEQVINITASSNNQAVIADGDIVVDYTSDSPKATLTVTASNTGTANITVVVTDDGGGTNTANMTFAIEAFQSLNNVPEMNGVGDQLTYNSLGQQVIDLSGISDGEGFAQNLVISAVSSAPAVADVDSVVYNQGSVSAKLYYTPVANGDATFSITVADDGGNVNNNGDQQITRDFNVEVKTAPVTSKEFEFNNDGNAEGWGAWGNGSMTVTGGSLFYDVDKPKWGPFGVNISPSLNMVPNPYITVRVRANEPCVLSMWLRSEGILANNNSERLNITTSWQTYTFDFTDPEKRMTGGGDTVTLSDVTLIHCLIDPNYANNTSEVEFDYIRMGSSAEKPTATVLVDGIPNQVVFEGADPVVLDISGVSDGDIGDDVVALSATSDNTGLIPNPVVSSVSNGMATLTFDAAASGTGEATITVDAAAPNSNPTSLTFTVYVVENNAGTAETIDIDYGTTYQTIEGFGAYGYNENFLKEYYEDLGASAIRIGFIGEQIERINDNADPNELNRDALDYTAHDWDILRELHENGVERFILTAWSPPAWMKGNLSESFQQAGAPNYDATDCKLLPEYYDEYAEMWVAAYRILQEESGIDLYGIGPQNEPAFTEPYPSAILDPTHFVDVIKVIGQRLEAEGISTNLYMPEQVFSQGHYSMAEYTDAVQADAEANRLTSVIATHGYASDGVGEGAASQTEWVNMWNNAQEGAYPKRMWMTETSGGDNTWDDFLNAAGAIQGALKYGNVSFWTWWSFHVGSGGRGYGLIAGDEKTPRYYSSKHYFKFVKPGAERIEVSEPHDSLLTVAFFNDAAHGNTTSIIVINKDDQVHNIDLNFTGGTTPSKLEVYQTLRYQGCQKMATVSNTDVISLPPYSVTTLASISNIAPTIDPVDDVIHIFGNVADDINLTGITDGGDGGQAITVTATSSDNTILNNVSVAYTSPNNTAVLSYDAVGDAGETASITITVTDDGGTSGGGVDEITETFNVEILSNYNEVPTLGPISDADLLEDDAQQTVSLTGISDGDGGTQTVTLAATSSNPDVIPNPTIAYTGGATASLTYTPLADSNGVAVITVEVGDDGGEAGNNGDQSALQTFTVNVVAVNDVPTIRTIDDVNTEDFNISIKLELFDITDGDAEVEQVISLAAASSSDAIVGIDSIVLDTFPGKGNLYYTPKSAGTATITVTVSDDGGTANGGVDQVQTTFDIIVTSGSGTINIIEVFDNALEMYPNPAHELVTIQLPKGANHSLSITDISGKEIRNMTLTNNTGSVDLNVSRISSGVYFVIIDNESGAYRGKLVIE